MTHRLPRAVHRDTEARQTVDEVLAAVRGAAAELLASSPQPPSTLNVRVGDVAVEMAWQPSRAEGAAPSVAGTVVPLTPPTPPAPPAGPTINAATVGTFYRSPAPGAPPFVTEGDEVSAGQQVAIVEAMKLMLPVEAERGGRVEEVLVADGEGVEYGQPLFRLASDAVTEESELAA